MIVFLCFLHFSTYRLMISSTSNIFYFNVVALRRTILLQGTEAEQGANIILLTSTLNNHFVLLSFDVPQKYFARYFYFPRGIDLFVFGTYKLNRTLYENLSCRRRWGSPTNHIMKLKVVFLTKRKEETEFYGWTTHHLNVQQTTHRSK